MKFACSDMKSVVVPLYSNNYITSFVKWQQKQKWLKQKQTNKTLTSDWRRRGGWTCKRRSCWCVSHASLSTLCTPWKAGRKML